MLGNPGLQEGGLAPPSPVTGRLCVCVSGEDLGSQEGLDFYVPTFHLCLLVSGSVGRIFGTSVSVMLSASLQWNE